MISFFMTVARLVVAFFRGLADREFRALFAILAILILSGTVFYSSVEDWSVVDALYFCVMTLATIGYGDLAPTTAVSKLFTVVYVFGGLGVFAGFISRLAAHQRARRGSKPEDRQDLDLEE